MFMPTSLAILATRFSRRPSFSVRVCSDIFVCTEFRLSNLRFRCFFPRLFAEQVDSGNLVSAVFSGDCVETAGCTGHRTPGAFESHRLSGYRPVSPRSGSCQCRLSGRRATRVFWYRIQKGRQQPPASPLKHWSRHRCRGEAQSLKLSWATAPTALQTRFPRPARALSI